MRNPALERFDGNVTGNSSEARELFQTLEHSVGGIVYLDIAFSDELDTKKPSNPDWMANDDSAPCGVEYLIRNVGLDTDSGFFWMRSQWHLTGYFAVVDVTGPFQSSFSVVLRAVPIDQALPATTP